MWHSVSGTWPRLLAAARAVVDEMTAVDENVTARVVAARVVAAHRGELGDGADEYLAQLEREVQVYLSDLTTQP